MADRKISQLTSLSTPSGEDLFVVVDDPNGTPVSKSITLQTLLANLPANTAITGTATVNGDTLIVTTAKTPASAAATGVQGQIAWDASYIYVCTATNNWKRAALATW